ncbi:MAG: S9 family peptidase [Cyanobacteria bacterium TGS_CYA1]|nr:S9 family peptidase [Cyanobacteria bacterium TGS_CYA1]
MRRAVALALFALFSCETKTNAEELSTRPEFIARAVLQAGRCTYPSFSPDDSRIAFVSNLAGRPNIFVVDRKGGWPKQITALDEDVIGLDWSPTLDQIVFMAGQGKRRVYSVKSDGTELFSWSNTNGNDQIGGWLRDGKELLFSRLDTAYKNSLAVLNIEDKKLDSLCPANQLSSITDLTKDKSIGLLSIWNRAGDNDLFLLDFKSNKKTLLTKHEEASEFYGGGINRSVAQFGSDDASVYFALANEKQEGFARIKFDQSQNPSTLELLAEGKLLGFVFNKNRDKAILCFKKNNEVTLSLWNEKTNKLTELGKCPGRGVYSFAISHDEKTVAMQLANWYGQEDIWLLNIDTKQFEQLTHSPRAGFDSKNLAEPKFEKFHSPGTEEVSCTIYEPKGHKNERIPFILDFGGISDAQVAALNLLGIGVMQPEFDSIKSRNFDDNIYKAWTEAESRRRAITTIQDCISFLVTEHAADQSKIGVMGHSFNGYLTWVALTELPELFKAGAIQGGLSDIRTMLKYTTPDRAKYFAEYSKNLTPELKAKHLDLLSPVKHEKNIKAAVLIEHGVKDTQCPVQDADAIAKLLKDRGAKVEYLRLANEGHGFSSKDARLQVSSKLVDFFAKQLNSKK